MLRQSMNSQPSCLQMHWIIQRRNFNLWLHGVSMLQLPTGMQHTYQVSKRKLTLKWCYLPLIPNLLTSDTKSKGATKVVIHSSDTDVLVLAIRCYPDLCKDIAFETGTGENCRSVPIGPIYDASGASISAALPAFHSITGTGVTGMFAGKAKPTCWKAFDDLSESTLPAILVQLFNHQKKPFLL